MEDRKMTVMERTASSGSHNNAPSPTGEKDVLEKCAHKILFGKYEGKVPVGGMEIR
jgi:hypothetical protein